MKVQHKELIEKFMKEPSRILQLKLIELFWCVTKTYQWLNLNKLKLTIIILKVKQTEKFSRLIWLLMVFLLSKTHLDQKLKPLLNKSRQQVFKLLCAQVITLIPLLLFLLMPESSLKKKSIKMKNLKSTAAWPEKISEPQLVDLYSFKIQKKMLSK